MAMRVKGTGFVGIGWRPKSATKKCQALPILQDKQKSSPKSLWTNEKKSAEPEAEAEGESAEEKSADAESADAESAVAESADAEGKSLEDILAEESSEEENSSKELTRKARKIVNKSVDVSIGYVTHSVSTGKRRRRQAEKEEGIIILFRQFVGWVLVQSKKVLTLISKYSSIKSPLIDNCQNTKVKTGINGKKSVNNILDTLISMAYAYRSLKKNFCLQTIMIF